MISANCFFTNLPVRALWSTNMRSRWWSKGDWPLEQSDPRYTHSSSFYFVYHLKQSPCSMNVSYFIVLLFLCCILQHCIVACVDCSSCFIPSSEPGAPRPPLLSWTVPLQRCASGLPEGFRLSSTQQTNTKHFHQIYPLQLSRLIISFTLTSEAAFFTRPLFQILKAFITKRLFL